MTTTDTAEPEESPVTPAEPDEPTEPRRGANPFLLVALVLAVVAAGFAVWFGLAWSNAAGDDDLELARMRDEVTRVGSAGIATFNTLDYRDIDEGLNRWESAATGPLLDEVNAVRTSNKPAIEQAKTTTVATVLKTAVTELQDRDGKAVVVAAIRIDVTVEGQPPANKFQRVQGSLERTDTGWKLSGIGYVPFTPAG